MPGGLVFKDQSAYDLKLTVTPGDLDRSQFQIVNEDVLETSHFKIEAAIIGASHVVTVEKKNGPKINEVFACTDVRADNKLLSFGRLSDVLGNAEFVHQKKLGYRLHVDCFDIKDRRGQIDKLEMMTAQALGQADKIGLSYTFPKKDTDIIDPKTIVHVVGISLITISTVHIYPSEGVFVLTQTEIM